MGMVDSGVFCGVGVGNMGLNLIFWVLNLLFLGLVFISVFNFFI